MSRQYRATKSPYPNLLYLSVILSIIAVVVAIVGLRELGDDSVTCDGKEMSSGDTCVTYSGDSVERSSYTEERAAQQNATVVLWIAVGVLLMPAAAYQLLMTSHRRQRRAAERRN